MPISGCVGTAFLIFHVDCIHERSFCLYMHGRFAMTFVSRPLGPSESGELQSKHYLYVELERMNGLQGGRQNLESIEGNPRVHIYHLIGLQICTGCPALRTNKEVRSAGAGVAFSGVYAMLIA